MIILNRELLSTHLCLLFTPLYLILIFKFLIIYLYLLFFQKCPLRFSSTHSLLIYLNISHLHFFLCFFFIFLNLTFKNSHHNFLCKHFDKNTGRDFFFSLTFSFLFSSINIEITLVTNLPKHINVLTFNTFT